MFHKIFIGVLFCFVAAASSAQKNIEFVIPFAPGGTADKLANILIVPIREELVRLNLNPVLSYRPGAGSTLAAASVAKADRLQIFLAPNAVVTATIVNQSTVSYNLETDFAPVIYLGHIPMVLAVNANSKIRSVQDLRKECQIKPLTYGSAGIGSATHISSALVASAIKCPAVHVPYKGVGPALMDLQGGHINFVTDFVTSLRPHIESQSLRPILNVERSRGSDFPKLPSMTDIGDQDYDFYNWFVLALNHAEPSVAPAVRLALQNVIERQDVQEQLKEAGLRGTGKAINTSFFGIEHAKFKRIIIRANIDAK